MSVENPLPIRGKVGPHGEMYIPQHTKEQTFRREAIVPDHEWDKKGPKYIAGILRQLADDIELYAKHGFQTDYKMWPYDLPQEERYPKPITTPLIKMEAGAHIMEPPSAFFAGSDDCGWRVDMTLRLQFE